ncbi:MAG: 4'-phosphopantetheinyl transferase superfamily protein [Flavobacteriales bacterium]|nr:4'-phosphopantetheinyl transferase superfamily protein [Flavobacteriales bacterium]MCB9174348.1 4'-phosphopantetheinyl transferase superfamily protein [Flavobacteriales bacterium]
MPLLNKKNITDSLTVGIWHISESQAELKNNYINKGFDEIDIVETKSESRLKQWLSVRLLLNEIYSDASITYDKFGKPMLSNGVEISISHAGDYAVIALNSTKKCGIDIEQISSKVERIKEKFLSLDELEKVTSLEELTLFWCAKEALYKLYGKKELIFNEQLFVDVKNKPNNLLGRIKIGENEDVHELVAEKIGDYLLVYTI